jgi:hypothetical protein
MQGREGGRVGGRKGGREGFPPWDARQTLIPEVQILDHAHDLPSKLVNEKLQ